MWSLIPLVPVFLEPFQDLRSIVRQNKVGACSHEAVHRLHDSCAQIKNASLSSMPNHGVLARDLVHGQWVVGRDLSGIAQNVQIRCTGLDHQHISTFAHVTDQGTAGQTASLRWKLITFTVSASGSGVAGITDNFWKVERKKTNWMSQTCGRIWIGFFPHWEKVAGTPTFIKSREWKESAAKVCLPEGSIESTGKLGRVTHQADLVGNTLLDQRILDRLDAAVHHVTGRDHLATSTGIRH